MKRLIPALLIFALASSAQAFDTRMIKNTLPLVDQRGVALANVPITFTMVNSSKSPADCWVPITGERVAPIPVTVKTNASGKFTVTLATTSQCSEARYYLCHVTSPYAGIIDFMAPLDTSLGSDMEWVSFKAAGTTLTATGISFFTTYALTPAQKAALDAATTLSGTNRVATYGDITAVNDSINLLNSIYVPITTNQNITLSSVTGCAEGWQEGDLATEVDTLIAVGINADNIICRDTLGGDGGSVDLVGVPEYDNGTCTTAATINANNGTRQKITLTNSQECVLSFTQPTTGTRVVGIQVVQSSAGSYDGAISGGLWPRGIIPQITTTAGAVDFVSCYFDGISTYCAIAQDFR